MLIQLIHPPAFLNPTALTALRPSLPLGLAYVAAAARRAGFEVSLIDAVGEAPDLVVREGDVARLGLSVSDIVERLDPQADIIAVSAMFTYQWRIVKTLLTAIKKARPDALLLGGGEHFTGLPDESLETSEIDILAIGEGEEILVDAAERYQKWRAEHPDDDIRAGIPDWAAECAGTVYRKDDGVHHEVRRNRIRDVDDIARPAWDLFDVVAYDERRLVNGVVKGASIPILATRGCPYQCKYCSSPNAWTTLWRPRDPQLVADEIQHWKETYGATNFPFQDLTAIMKRKWIVEFCNEIIDRELNITWQMPTGTRCEVVDDEVSALLMRSGACQVNFAPESGSERVRIKIDKKMSKESLFGAVHNAVRNGLNVTCFFVLGFPGDEASDLRETVKWCGKLAKAGVDDVAVGFYFPIPGTRFYQELESRGHVELSDDLIMAPIFVHDRWLTEKRNYSEGMSARALTYWRYRAVWAFYSRAILLKPSRVFRIVRNFVAGREESKFDSFLQILKERFFTRRAKKTQVSTAPQPEPTVREKEPTAV